MTVERADLVKMLRREATEAGLTLERFYELGRADKLDSPRLRDLWLIWGDVLTPGDLALATNG